MSNGIGKNALNDISKVYLQQIAEKKRDNSYLEPDMKKRQANNEKAIKDMKKMGTSMKNPHFEENQMEGVRDTDPEKGTKERKARLEKKRGMKLDDHPQYKKEEVEVDEAMSSYDRNRKRAAQRAAARNAARDAGKTGVVPGVGYVSPRRERETYVDSAGTTRHKSGAKMEEVENVKEEAAMSPQEIQLQKRKAQIDKMIAQKRQQALSKAKSSEAPAKAMGEATCPSDFINPDGSKRAVAKKKTGRPVQHDQPMSGGRRKTVDESAEDRLRDRRMERGGVDGNVDYRRPARTATGPKKKPSGNSMSAFDKVVGDLKAKYGDKAVMAKKTERK